MTTAFAPIAGEPLQLQDHLWLLLAPNPSPMTYLGTNTYVLGQDDLVIIDPGPDDPAHLDALTATIAGRPVSYILVTHSHLDHSPLAARLSAMTKAPVCAFGDSMTGRSDVMTQLANDGLTGGGEGVDYAFRPDRVLRDGEILTGSWGELRALHTPGHMGNHLSFVWADAIFTGDLVMGWASSLVSPPDGDVADFITSCRCLAAISADVFYPGHGAPIHAPQQRVDWLISHRLARESQILAALANNPSDTVQITAEVYQDVAPALRPAAERNVFAHLVDLHQRGKVTAMPGLSVTAVFALP